MSGFVGRPARTSPLAVPLSYSLCAFTDSEVITCLACSAMKWQVHSPLINAEARTPAISSQEEWNVLNETLQNKHTAVHGCVTSNHPTGAKNKQVYTFIWILSDPFVRTYFAS